MLFTMLLAQVAEPGLEGENAGAAGWPAPSFEALYEQHAPFVWRAVQRLGVPAGAVADVVQEIFLVVHRRLPEYRERRSVRAWLYAIVVRAARDYRRSVRRKSPASMHPDGPGDPDALADVGRPDPHASAERTQALRLVYELLSSLDEEKREVFVLSELEQLTGPEIAEALGANVNTVSWRLRMARRDFEAALERHRARERRTGR
ncbi:MAG TPA: sigma-70 family RNA polymerase sigma factor [Polyangiaceae bacterium]|nr:sigma-70 family RNA polymerase sigma factor [Polyangiaceae bacterium]